MSMTRIPFTARDEDRIASTALWGTIVGVTVIASALIDTGLAAYALRGTPLATVFKSLWSAVLGQLVGLGVSIAIGVWLLQASRALHLVARTDIADKMYFRRAFHKLHSAFMVYGVVIIVLLVGAGALVVLSLAAGMSGAGPLAQLAGHVAFFFAGVIW